MRSCAHRASASPALRGFAVLEALLAASALALGLLAAARLAERAWQASAHSRAHAQAQLLAREALDCVLAEPASAALRCPASRHSLQGHTDYALTLEHSDLGPPLQEVWVLVSWTEPGHTQPLRLRWGTRIANLRAAEAAEGGVALGVSSGP